MCLICSLSNTMQSPALSAANPQFLVPLGTEPEADESSERDAEETIEDHRNGHAGEINQFNC